MIEKRLLITFQTTTEAMAWERACRAEGLPGRLIPVPPLIKAGCGLAWLATAAGREILLERANFLGLNYESVHMVDRMR